MAVYFNLGIDCGPDPEAAVRAAAHFQGFTISLPGIAPVACDVSSARARGLEFVGVWPRGMSHALPTWDDRPELTGDEATIGKIRDAMYRHLAGLRGYRRAMFGGEAYDMLLGATEEEDADVDYTDMVFSAADFAAPQGRAVTAFSPGYLRVLPTTSA